MSSSNSNSEPSSLLDISPYSISLPNETKTDSQSNEEFKSLIQRINKILNQTEFDVNNGEYIYKEHCNELRRQVQLAKETQIQKIEDITDSLMNEIDEFERESLQNVSKVNKEQLVNKLNEMKQENEKWNQRLDEFKVDNQMLNQLRDSLSKIAVERDNFNCLLHNKMMKFKEHKDQSFVGELSQVSLDSFEQIFIKKQIEEIKKRYILEYDVTGIPIPIFFNLSKGKVLSNGDLLLCGKISYDVVLAVFDSNKDFKLKKFKQLCIHLDSMATSSDKICLSYQIKDRPRRYRARETEDDKEYQESDDKADDYVVLILNENLEKLHRFKSHKMQLVGANDSFLFFAYDSEHQDGVLSFYTWSMEYVKSIGQSDDQDLPFYFSEEYVMFSSLKKMEIRSGRYYLWYNWAYGFDGLTVFDEETGILLEEINEIDDFCLDHNFNIILSDENSIQYLSFNGDLLKEIQIGKLEYHIIFILNNDKRCLSYNLDYDQLCFWNKYDENTHEVA